MPNRNHCTYQAALRAQARVAAAREELTAEEPMHRYTHPIPLSCSTSCSGCGCGEQCQTLTQILEQLQTQSQLQADLLEAVKGLTSLLLARTAPGG